MGKCFSTNTANKKQTDNEHYIERNEPIPIDTTTPIVIKIVLVGTKAQPDVYVHRPSSDFQNKVHPRTNSYMTKISERSHA